MAPTRLQGLGARPVLCLRCALGDAKLLRQPKSKDIGGRTGGNASTFFWVLIQKQRPPKSQIKTMKKFNNPDFTHNNEIA